MKKITLIFFACLLLLASTGIAFAGLEQKTYNSLSIVDGDGSYTTPLSFNWNQTPWLYVNFTSDKNAMPQTFSGWWSPSGVMTNLHYTSPDKSYRELWMSFSNWPSLQEAGLWTVSNIYTHIDGQEFKGPNRAFTVNAVPEPISSALFLLGGSALALRVYRKRRKKA